MSSIIDRINAPAAEKVTAGMNLKIDDFTVAEVENTLANDGTMRPQMIVYSGDKTYYAPTPVARLVWEAVQNGEDVRKDLIGRTLVIEEYYSNRWRRMLLKGRIE